MPSWAGRGESQYVFNVGPSSNWLTMKNTSPRPEAVPTGKLMVFIKAEHAMNVRSARCKTADRTSNAKPLQKIILLTTACGEKTEIAPLSAWTLLTSNLYPRKAIQAQTPIGKNRKGRLTGSDGDCEPITIAKIPATETTRRTIELIKRVSP